MDNNNQEVFHSANSGVTRSNNNSVNNIPYNYKPLSAWAYFGYQILFSIPIVGFIFLIVFSFSNNNINRRNFARSYWCSFLLAVIMIVILFIIFGSTIFANVDNISSYIKFN